MNDLNRALEDLSHIRSQIAAVRAFRGFGPQFVALSGIAALLLGAWQVHNDVSGNGPFFEQWIALAVLTVALIGLDLLVRVRAYHGSLSASFAWNSVEHFLPAGLAGAAIAGVILRYAPQSAWLLPGLWQVLLALAIFAAARSLPQGIRLVAGWYLLCGISVILLSVGSAPGPWGMAVPFGTGQLMTALVLRQEKA